MIDVGSQATIGLTLLEGINHSGLPPAPMPLTGPRPQRKAARLALMNILLNLSYYSVTTCQGLWVILQRSKSSGNSSAWA